MSGLIPDHSYRFRVIPYKDDLFGRPLESTTLYTAPTATKYTDVSGLDMIRIPPPRGPLQIERLSTGMHRLSWLPPHVHSITDRARPHTLDEDLEYVIEQRVPHRRMWLEVGRTRLPHFTTPVDTTSQFRIRSVISDYATQRSKYPYSLSYDALTSDWVYVDDERDIEFQDITTRRLRRSVSRSKIREYDIDRFVPDHLTASHVGRTSVLLEWRSPMKTEMLRDIYTDYLLLEKRLVDNYRLSVWEPVAHIPIAHLPSGRYEVRGLRSGTQYDFRLVGIHDATGYRSTKTAQLSTAVFTHGEPEDQLPMTLLAAPKVPTARIFSDKADEEIRLRWLAPELPERIVPKVRYHVEAKAFDGSGLPLTDWLSLASDVVRTDYSVYRSKLDRLSESSEKQVTGRKSRSVTDDAIRDARHWKFRVFATVDDRASAPAVVPDTIALVPKSSKSPFSSLSLIPLLNARFCRTKNLYAKFSDRSPCRQCIG